MMRILTVDDHDVVREGVKRIFDETSVKAEVGEARSGPEALDLVRAHEWDIVLLDISLGGRSGIDVLKDLKQIRPRLPVLILSMHSEEQYALRAFKAGASGYLTKGSPTGELINAINKIVGGGKYISPSLAEKMIVDISSQFGKPPHETLSDREYEVLCLIASGKTVSAIAEELSLSDKTISTYRARILEKMGMKSNAELTRYAIQNQLVH